MTSAEHSAQHRRHTCVPQSAAPRQRLSRPRISAAIIVQNEAPQLPGLIESLRFVDEVVIVDGGSRDETLSLARELGCRTFLHPFETFAAQRNRAIDFTRGAWVLSIDADERPTPALAAELLEIVRHSERGEPQVTAYRLPIRSRIFGRRMRFSGTQDDRPVRFFRRDAARWTGDVHERLAVRGRIAEARGILEHTTLPNLQAFLRKMDRYTTLEAQARLHAGRRPRWRERWLAPWVEFGRRFLWKGGFLDGPHGWAFCALSGLSKWVEADKLRRLLGQQVQAAALQPRREADRLLRRLPPVVRPFLQEAPRGR